MGLLGLAKGRLHNVITGWSFSPAQAVRFCCSAYFLLNASILATYPLFRQHVMPRHIDIRGIGLTGFEHWMLGTFPTLEKQMALALLITAVARSFRAASAAGLVSTFIFWARLFVIIVSAVSDTVVCCYYLLAFLLVCLLVNEPNVEGRNAVKSITADTVLSIKDRTPPNDSRKYVIFFHTTWSKRCLHAFPLYADVSNKYASDTVEFARMDVGTWPAIAKELDIDMSSTSGALPTVIAFKGGKEVGRVPSTEAARAAGAVMKWPFTKADLITGLQLDGGKGPATATPVKAGKKGWFKKKTA